MGVKDVQIASIPVCPVLLNLGQPPACEDSRVHPQISGDWLADFHILFANPCVNACVCGCSHFCGDGILRVFISQFVLYLAFMRH